MRRGRLSVGFTDYTMIQLTAPFTEEKIRAKKVRDEGLISGIVFTECGIMG